MLKWEPPGPDVRWSDALSAEQAKRTASTWTPNALSEILSVVLRYVRPDRFSKKPRGLRESNPDMFWRTGRRGAVRQKSYRTGRPVPHALWNSDPPLAPA